MPAKYMQWLWAPVPKAPVASVSGAKGPGGMGVSPVTKYHIS